MHKMTIPKLIQMKKTGKKIVAITCYSHWMANIINETEVDVILVGDSLGMVELGYEDTLPVTIDEMIHHIKAVKRSLPSALLVADMPFMSFNISKEETLKNAGALIKKCGAQAVKLEGGEIVSDITKFLIKNNIPVMGHLGLTPQSLHKMGGYKVQGKIKEEAAKIIKEAKILEDAGVFAIVLEAVPAELAQQITQKVSVPTIGIGAGVGCDGQILVINDLLGINLKFNPKFVRKYATLHNNILKAIKNYSNDVKSGKFPSEKESY